MSSDIRLPYLIKNFFQIDELPMEISTNIYWWLDFQEHWLFRKNFLRFIAQPHNLSLAKGKSIGVMFTGMVKLRNYRVYVQGILDSTIIHIEYLLLHLIIYFEKVVKEIVKKCLEK